jgi:hypothetical protein
MAYVEPGISLTLDWNVLENSAFAFGGWVYIDIFTWDGVDKFRNFHYYLSAMSPPNNGSIDASFDLNDTLNEWHTFDRNITEDYIAVWGAGDLTANQYVTYVRFKSYVSTGSPGLMRAAFDNVVLTNGTYSAWVGNGDFETGTATPWSATEMSRAFMEQSTDSFHGTYSLNLSIPMNTGGFGTTYIRKYFDYPGGFFAHSSGLTTIEIDWKYDNNVTIMDTQQADMQLGFRNETGSYSVWLYFGTYNDLLPGVNISTQHFFKMPGFGARNSWQHSTLDLYDYTSVMGLTNVSLFEIQIACRNDAEGAYTYLLLDNFQLITYPMGDPGFEVDWYSSVSTPFAGWPYWNGETGVISRTDDSRTGNYACNLTVTDDDSAGVWRQHSLELNPLDFLSLFWRLDDVGVGTSHADMEIRFSDNNYLNYIFGAGSSHNPSNSSSYKYVRVEDFNVTGEWHRLILNLTDNAEEAFGALVDRSILSVKLDTWATSSERVSILFDDFHFIDGVPPVIDNVVFFPSTPMYYDDVEVTIWAHDERGFMGNVYVDYFDGTSWDYEMATPTISNYTMTIPAQDYGTTVFFFVSASTVASIHSFAFNEYGGFFNYTVGDDIYPTIDITSHSHDDPVEGVVAIDVAATDAGSGIDYVEWRLDGHVMGTDDTEPYSLDIDFDAQSLGEHALTVETYDHAGNLMNLSIDLQVVDTTSPTINSPVDIEFTEGATGFEILWIPYDATPTSYEIFLDEVSMRSGQWNSTSETILVSLDGLTPGLYNYTVIVFDEMGFFNVDTVWVTVNEVVITTTTTTTTTTTDTTTSPTSSLPAPPPPAPDEGLLILVAGAGGLTVLVLAVVLMRKKN